MRGVDRKSARVTAARAAALAVAFTLAGATTSVAATAGSSAARAAKAEPSAIWGVTVDEISRLGAIVEGLAALPERPTTRVYFDVREPASYYVRALTQIDSVGAVMGELLDSSDERAISVAAFQTRTESYLSTLAGKVDIWEIGNEVNGNWTGTHRAVAAKLTEAYEDVSAAGGKTALTLYANNFGPDHCGDGAGELTPIQFSQRYVPGSVADGLDYVLLSYYPTQCGGIEPSSEELASYLQELHGIYPNAALGIGEVGLPRAATRSTLAKAEQIMRWAYSLHPGLPYYVGGYFWWYGAEDALEPNSPLRGALASAFDAESEALADSGTITP